MDFCFCFEILICSAKESREGPQQKRGEQTGEGRRTRIRKGKPKLPVMPKRPTMAWNAWNVFQQSKCKEMKELSGTERIKKCGELW
jgi:hypothetical protein